MKRPALLGLVALALALAAGPGFFAPEPANAHSLLVRADPAVNAQLLDPPEVMTLYFSEALERRVSNVRVLDADQEIVSTGVEFSDEDDALMRVGLQPLEPGFYTVTWETLSKVDGHRISGSYPITILRPDGSQPPGQIPSLTGQGATVSGTEADPERVVTKWALLVAGSVLTGGLAFAWVAGGAWGQSAEAARRAALARIVLAVTVALGVMVIAGFVELALQAREVFGSVRDSFEVLDSTRWGERWTIRNALLLPMVAGAFVLERRRSDAKVAGLLVAGLLALAIAYLAIVSTVSHAAAGRGAVWATIADFAHLVAASVWIGMLLQLALLIRWARKEAPRNQQPQVIAGALRRFSLLAVSSIGLLLFTGTVNSAIELDRLSDLVDTGYGVSLLIKLILIVPLFFAGALNAYLFRPQVEDEADRVMTGRRGGLTSGWEDLEATLTRTLRIETGMAVVVLLVVGVLVQLPPPRNGLGDPGSSGPFTESRTVEGVAVTLGIDPNRPGQNTFETFLAGDATSVERVNLVFEAKGGGGFQSDLILEPSNPPVYYIGTGAFLNEPGDWTVTVNLRRSSGRDLSIPFDVKVTAPGAVAQASRGGSFASPRDFSTEAIVLMAASAVLALGIVWASLDRPGRPAGLTGDWADRVASVEVKPSVSLAALLLVGIGIGILAGTHGHDILRGDAAREGNRVPATAESIERGRQLFIQNCIQCHGETGRGDGPLASTLPLQPANLYDHIPYHPDQFFFNIITNGLSGVMPAFGSGISEEDRWNILNFLRDEFGEGEATQ